MVLTRAKFDELTADLVERCIGPFRQALADAKLTEKDLDEVILVGGATRMPSVQELVRRLTGKEPNKEVHPDEVVAVGAAIQAGVLAGEVREVVLLDVTPLSLGIETLGGVMTVLIPRNTTIPTRKTEVFSTAEDGQTAVDVHVLQGERPMARDNRTLGKFLLDGIPPAPRGVPQIEVTFDIDANGILNVSAKDMATKKEQKITITASTGLSKDEAERMRKEADSHAEEDRKRLAEVEARNRCDNLVYQTEKLIRENRDKLAEADIKAAEEAIESCRRAMSEGGVDRINSATEALMQASHRIAEALYKAGAAAGTPGAAASSTTEGAGAKTPGQGEVIDAEYVDVDESKKPN
jgi:molecular chaperone DnaK